MKPTALPGLEGEPNPAAMDITRLEKTVLIAALAAALLFFIIKILIDLRKSHYE